MTAGVTRLDAFVKAIETVFRGIGVDIVLLGPEATDFNAETFLGFIDEIDGFLEQTAGFQRHDIDRQPVRTDGGGDDLIFDAEAGGEDRTAAKTGDEGKSSRKIEPGKRGVEGCGIGRGIC
ncbi:hypothetical protein D3C80_1560810 [compost metagenome]